MDFNDVWGADTAERYDADNAEISAPQVVGPTVDLLVDLAEGGRVLELAIGTGRVAVPLADRGVSVSGIELSGPMVAQLRTKADAERIPVAIGDMARTTVPGEFALVYLVFNTLSNLIEQSDQITCFRNAAAHLAPGGRFVVEMWVPDLTQLNPDRTAAIFETAPGRIGLDTYDLLAQHVVSHHFRFGPTGTEAALFRSRHRYAWPAEMDLMAQLAGFSLENRWADWDRSPFTAQSGSHVSVYRLPQD